VPENDKQLAAGRRIRSVTYLGAAVNIALSIVKLAIGLAVGSLAMVADAVHSLSDLATDIVVVVGSHLGARKPDRTHPYGHGRLETFSAVAVALVLMVVGGAMVYQGTMAIARNEPTAAHWAILAGASLSILSKEWLYRVTRKVAVSLHSAAAYANAWHHRSDAFSSVAVLVGYISMRLGFDHGDQVAAIAVGLMIILVDPELNIAAAHEISEGLEKALDEEILRPVHITVHIEPDLPSFRR
jgi:cation diffusion facilitator family transporter